MINFTQRNDQYSSIIPSGFTGIIVKNSTVNVEDSYVKNGQSFINAFDNSNVTLTNCGTPQPSGANTSTQYELYESKLFDEVERKTLPFWFHYKLFKSDQDLYSTQSKNSLIDSTIKLQTVLQDKFSSLPYSIIKEYRNQLLQTRLISGMSLGLQNSHVVNPSQLINYRINYDQLNGTFENNSFGTSDISYTVAGTYYLSGVTSSIKTVFPFNKNKMLNSDSPNLLLTLKQRYTTDIIDKNGEKIYVNNIIKTDQLGNKLQNNKKTILDNLSFYYGQIGINNNIYKLIAKTSSSSPISSGFKKLSYNKSSNKVNLNVNYQLYSNDEKSILTSYYLTQPYTKDTIAYKKYKSDGTKNYQWVNATSPLTLYFKSPLDKETIYDVNKFINKNFNTNNSIDSNIFSNYFKNRVDEMYNSFNNKSSTLQLDVHELSSASIIRKYNPNKLNSNDTSHQDGYPKAYNQKMYVVGLNLTDFLLNEQLSYSNRKLYTTSGNLQKQTYQDITNNIIENSLTTKNMDELICSNFLRCGEKSIYTKITNGVFGNYTKDNISNLLFTGYVQYDTYINCSAILTSKITSYNTKQYKKDGSSKIISLDNIQDNIEIKYNQLLNLAENQTSSLIDDVQIANNQVIFGYTDTVNSGLVAIGIGSGLLSSDFKLDNLQLSSKNVQLSSIYDEIQFQNKVIQEKLLSYIPSSSISLAKSILFEKKNSYQNISYSQKIQSSPIINIEISGYHSQDVSSFTLFSGQIDNKNIELTTNYDYTDDSNIAITIKNLKQIITKIVSESQSQSINYVKYEIIVNSIKIYVGSTLDFNQDSIKYYIQKSELQKLKEKPTRIKYYNNNSLFMVYNPSLSSTQKQNLQGQQIYNFNNQNQLLSGNYPSFLKFEGLKIKQNGTQIIIDQQSSNENLIPSSIIKDNILSLSGIYYTPSTQIYEFKKLLKIDSNQILSNDDNKYKIYIYPTTLLTITNVNNSYIENEYCNVKFQYSQNDGFLLLLNQKETYLDIITYSTQELFLTLYFDEACLNPIQIDPNDGGIYSYSLGRKQFISDAIIGNDNVGYDYTNQFLKIYDYQYQYITVYQYETAYDWYDINKFISCKDIFTDTNGEYRCNLLNYNNGKNVIVNQSDVIEQMFKNNYFQYTNSIILNYKNECMVSPFSLVLYDTFNLSESSSGLIEQYNQLKYSSLFTNSSQNNTSFKLFSFNFMIPSSQWLGLNDIIYSKNSKYMKNILTQESDLIFKSSLPDGLQSLKSTAQTFLNNYIYGKFSFVYMVLSNRCNQKVVGTLYKGTGTYVDRNGKSWTAYKFKQGKNGVQMGGSSLSGVNAYSYQFVQIDWVGTQKNVVNGKQIDITSPDNSTFSFSIFIPNSLNSGEYVDTQLNGLLFQIPFDNIIHYVYLQKIILRTTSLADNKVSFEFITHDVTINTSSQYLLELNANNSIAIKPSVLKQFNATLYNDKSINEFYNYYCRNICYNGEQNALLGTSKYNINVDQRNYPLRWIPLGSLMMYNQNVNSTTNNLNDISKSYFNYKFVSNIYSNLLKYSECSFTTNKNITDQNKLSQQYILDADEYNIPKDVSTNLFLYVADDNKQPITGAITSFNEYDVIMVNARKMHNDIDISQTKPADATLNLNFQLFKDNQMTLTALISGTSENQIYNKFSKIRIAYNLKNNKYQRILDNVVLNNTNLVECRYTGVGNHDGTQYNLFEYSQPITFTTTQDCLVNFQPSINNIVSGQSIQLPCKLNISLSGLIFKQICRRTISNDNMKDCTYQQNVFDDNLVNILSKNGGNSLNNPLKFIKLNSYSTNQNYYYNINNINDYFYQDRSFGGSSYFIDFVSLRTIKNNANNWQTNKLNSKLEQLTLYSDYYPSINQDDRIIGNPYLNLNKKVTIYDSFKEGTNTSDDSGITINQNYIAPLVKIATDIKNINVFSIESNFENYEYMSKFKQVEIYYNVISYNSSENMLKLNIHGKFKNYSSISQLIGKIQIQIDELLTNEIKYEFTGNTSNIITNQKKNVIEIYFDGCCGQKQAYIKYNGTSLNYPNSNIFLLLSYVYESNVYLNSNGEFSGSLLISCSSNNKSLLNQNVQLHTFKLPCPIIKAITIGYTKQQKENLNSNNYYVLSNGTWQKSLMYNNIAKSLFTQNQYDELGNISKKSSYPRAFFKSEWNNEIIGNSQLLSNQDGAITGILLSIKIPGLRKFKGSSIKYGLYNSNSIILSSQALLSSYNNNFGLSTEIDGQVKYLLDQFNPSATINEQVITGYISSTYQYIQTQPIKQSINGVGKIKYNFNPIGNTQFQLQVITKPASGQWDKKLYYINKDVNKWYNLAIYKTNKEISATNGEIIESSYLQFLLNEVSDQSFNNIISLPGKYFSVYTSNQSIIKGTSKDICFNINKPLNLQNIKTTLFPSNKDQYGNTLLNSCMSNYDSIYDISFDKSQRSYWTPIYNNEHKYLSYDKSLLSISNNINRGDIINIGSISFAKSIMSGFNKINSVIKLFANKEIQSILSSQQESGYTESYKFDSYQESDISENQLSSYLIQNTYPKRILFGGNTDNFLLMKRTHEDKIPLFRSVGIKASNFMFISTPNLSCNKTSGVIYTESNAQSLSAVNDYEQFFQNPQHRLPPVSYTFKILSSDYATFIYNNTSQITATSYNLVQKSSTQNSEIIYDYSKSPNVIAYVWHNAKVSRCENIRNSNSTISDSKLYWNKEKYDQYISQIGSIYNYVGSSSSANQTIQITATSLVERQCTLKPSLSIPLTIQKYSLEKARIKSNDVIIATAALGFNDIGMPINSIMKYTGNDWIYIDSTKNNYIYLYQSNGSCKLSSTLEKPVITENVEQNILSLAQNFTFLENPNISNKLLSDLDEGMTLIAAGNYSTLNKFVTSQNEIFTFYNGNNTSSNKSINKLRESLHETLFKTNIENNNLNIFVYPLNIATSNGSITQTSGNITYFQNMYCIPVTQYLNTKTTPTYIYDLYSFNVFYNKDEIIYPLTLNSKRSFVSLNCFNYDGKLLTYEQQKLQVQNLFNGQQYSYATSEIEKYSKYLETYNNCKSIDDVENQFDLDICPQFGVIWKNNSMDESSISSNWNINVDNISDNRTAIFDQYMSINISSIKFTIKQDELNYAPIYIKIKLLKYNTLKHKFYWLHDNSFDLDLRDTYETIYNYDSENDIIIEKNFENTTQEYSKHIFGIKFSIQQIVPQAKAFSPCKIYNIQICASNILNKYGNATSVQDVYIRKIDTNNDYNLKCSEYIWRLPNNISQWQAVSGIYNTLTDDYSQNNNQVVNNKINNIIQNYSNTNKIESIQELSGLNNKDISKVNSFYISPTNGFNKDISQVLSNNYLVQDTSMKISWKYIDYVYIYYSSFSTKARQLLDYYFGNKIYNAVKYKLQQNISNLNTNSQFGDKYKFTGGIAIQKNDQKQNVINAQAFSWKSDVRTDETKYWQDMYNTYHTHNDLYTNHWITTVVTTTKTAVDVHDGDDYKWDTATRSKSSYASTVNWTTLDNSWDTYNVWYTGTKNVGTNVSRTYLGTTMENVKYTSISNWINSFQPNEIKYVIN